MTRLFGGIKSDPRQERYDQLREVVSLGIAQFRRTGQALAEIRDQELWRLDCQTWAECCRMHWDISTQHAARLIDAALFADRIEPTGSPVPTSERQVRPLRGLEPAEQVAAWEEAQQAGGGPEAIEQAAARRRPKTRKAKTPRPIRLKVPGGTVVIEQNAKSQGPDALLRFALQMLQDREAKAA